MAKIKFEKLDLQTKDLTAINIEKIGALFPNVITEYETEQGEITKGIDFELLQQLLSKELVDGNKEKYQLNWPGRKAALLKANTPIKETLRPDLANSKNWDNTENVFIEGDNFTALKILQESYLGKIKLIYIDPPYNTGKDFVYSDKFTIEKAEYAEKIGQYDEENNKLFKEHSKTNPRYHSDWLSMMYGRLHIARDLLREDGVIFISIDDNEVHNLRKICDEIFGEENFVGMFSVENNPKGRKNGKFISVTNEYCLIYVKRIEIAVFDKIIPKHANDMIEDENGNFVRKSGKRVLMGENTLNNLVENFKSSKHYSAYIKDSDLIFRQENTLNEIDITLLKNGYTRYVTFRDGQFVENTYTQETFKELFDEESLDIRDNKIYEKHFSGKMQVKSILVNNEYEAILDNNKILYKIDLKTTSAKQELTNLLDGEYFSFPKNINFIKLLISLLGSLDDFIVLDFFAGSGTTAHAVMQLNAEDGGSRKYIMVQLDEETDEKSEAYKAGYKTIAELARERIRRAGDKILVENKDKLATRETELDIGFRAFRVDSTNMKDVYYHPKDLKQDNLLDLVDTIKADRTPEDLLIQVLLDKALTLDLPIKTQKFKNNTVYIVGDNDLIVCMDTVLDADIIDDLAQLGADTAVFRDSSFATEADRIKLETHFKRLSPRDTRILVI